MKWQELQRRHQPNLLEFSSDAEAEMIAMFRNYKDGQEESEKQQDEIMDLKDQLDEERKDWKQKVFVNTFDGCLTFTNI